MDNDIAMLWACIDVAVLTAGAVIVFLIIDYVRTHRECKREMGKIGERRPK